MPRDHEVVDRDQGRLVQRIAEECRSCADSSASYTFSFVAGLDPATHGPRQASYQLPWIPGTRPGMDEVGVLRVHCPIESEH
jgi:hypothetical protein